MHEDRSSPQLGLLANLLDHLNDVAVGPATADIAAHQFLYVGVIGPARLLQQRNRRHDLTSRAVSALVSVAEKECFLHGMPLARRAEAPDRSNLFAVVHEGQAQARNHAPPI